MIEESYVSFDTAKMLKEAGFDVPCLCCYTSDGEKGEIRIPINHNFGLDYSRPTQALAARWLREVHQIYVMLNPSLDGWILDLFDLKKHQYILCNQDTFVDNYESAMEKGLQEAIKLIKK